MRTYIVNRTFGDRSPFDTEFGRYKEILRHSRLFKVTRSRVSLYMGSITDQKNDVSSPFFRRDESRCYAGNLPEKEPVFFY